jgi:hypothetical protein
LSQNSTPRQYHAAVISVKIVLRMSEACSDQPLWQHFSNCKWYSFGEISTVLELEFRSNSSNSSSISEYGVIDFELMICIASNKLIRRLSPKEMPDVVYEWEDSAYGIGSGHPITRMTAKQ